MSIVAPLDPILSLSSAIHTRNPPPDAFSYMAMGNYPYPSQYILNGQGTLPAWPLRVACEALDFPFPNESASNTTLLEALREAVSVYYNYSGSGTLRCYDLNAGVNEESQNVECVAGVFCRGVDRSV